jgi:small subunit ribosomal protein S17
MTESREETVAPEAASAVASAEPLVPGALLDGPVGADDGRPNRRKIREGLIASTAMDKTVVVAVVERVRHPRYAKTMQRTKRILAHNEDETLKVGDRVRLSETRPLSKRKRWRVVEVLERAK